MRLKDEDIVKIQKLYLEIGTYSGVAKKLGFSPATVKKYVLMKREVKEEPIEKVLFKESILSIEETLNKYNGDIRKFGKLSKEEEKEIKNLWKEF